MIAAFHCHDRCDQFRGRTFGAWFTVRCEEEKNRQYLRSTSALWNLNKVVGLRISESFGIRSGRHLGKGVS